MRQAARRACTLDDYYGVELASEIKHEYYDGEIFAMAGGSTRHNRISGNIYAALHVALRGSTCEPFGSDQRVSTPSGLYTYPDASVFCGEMEYAVKPPDTLINPVVLFGVLSASTRNYGREAKFELYRAIPSLHDYVLIEQDEMHIEHHNRTDDEWQSRVLRTADNTLDLSSINFRVALREIYERVEFGKL